MWDESRLAVNALEMTLNGNWIVTYFDGQPDLWNTKPPLLIWLIALCMKLFGYNEFSLRLPSALAAISTTLIVVFFCKNYFHDLKMGLISGLVLITSTGFIGEHVARTADYDAMLVLWMTVYSLSYFAYLHSKTPRKNFYLAITTVALVLAVMTKSIAGLLALPALIIYTAYQKKLKEILISPQSYYSAIFFIALILGYYFLREHYSPGYLKSVINNEITGRYSTNLEGHNAPFTYYMNELKYKFVPWIYLFPIGCVIEYFNKSKKIKSFSIFGLLYFTCYWLIISSAKTKLPWYDAPLYPIASLVIGIGLSQILNSLLNYYQIKDLFKRQLMAGLIIASIFFIPYIDTVYYRIYKNKGIIYDWSHPSNPQLMYGEYFEKMSIFIPKVTRFSVVDNTEYNAHLMFYIKVANLGDYSIKSTSFEKSLTKNEVVVTCDSEAKADLEEHYELETLHTNHPCHTFAIKIVKP
ncbi:MAG: glycosyltransferase family 39 protein [Coleofasciculus sp. E2-BRE-01]